MATLEHNLETFQKIVNLVANPDIIIILSGSTSLALQGVDVKVHDIDIDTDETGAKLLDKILKGRQTSSLEYYSTDKYRSWHGRYALNGCDIDIMGNFQYRLEDGSWSIPEHLNKVHYVDYKGAKIPVLSLEQELQEYESTRRNLKAEKIQETLEKAC